MTNKKVCCRSHDNYQMKKERKEKTDRQTETKK